MQNDECSHSAIGGRSIAVAYGLTLHSSGTRPKAGEPLNFTLDAIAHITEE